MAKRRKPAAKPDLDFPDFLMAAAEEDAAPVDCGVDEDGDPVTTCVVQWEPYRPPPPKRRAPQRRKTDVTLQRAISDVGLPADPDALKAALTNFMVAPIIQLTRLGTGQLRPWASSW